MISGSPKATFHYPRFKYGAAPITIDLAEPAVAVTPMTAGLRGQNVVASGKAEYLFGRMEETVSMQLLCEPDQLQQLRWMVEDALALGTQFKAWVDRFTGSVWMFNDNLRDQNGLVLALNSGSAAYADAANGRGVVMTGATRLSVPIAQASASPPTGFDDPALYTEGVVVVDFKPAWATTDVLSHTIIHLMGPDPTKNALAVEDQGSGTLKLLVTDNTPLTKGIGGSVTWASGDRVQIVASWTPAGTLKLWYAVNSGAFIELTTASGSGAGAMTVVPTTLAIANRANLTTFSANGTYDTVAFFKRAFTNPHLTLSDFRPIARNYFPYAESTSPVFQPARLSPGRQIWQWPISIRNGAA